MRFAWTADDPPAAMLVGDALIPSTSHGLYETPLLTNPDTLLFVPHQLSVASSDSLSRPGATGVVVTTWDPVGPGFPNPTMTTA
jgi:hypothetical protein